MVAAWSGAAHRATWPSVTAVGGVEAAPAQARQKHFGPGVHVAATVLRVGLGLVAAHKTRGDPEAAAGRHEQHRDIAAGAAAAGERVGWRLGRPLDPDAAI